MNSSDYAAGRMCRMIWRLMRMVPDITEEAVWKTLELSFGPDFAKGWEDDKNQEFVFAHIANPEEKIH